MEAIRISNWLHGWSRGVRWGLNHTTPEKWENVAKTFTEGYHEGFKAGTRLRGTT